MGVFRSLNFSGSILIRCVAVIKASSQNFNGIEAFAKKEIPHQQCVYASIQLNHFVDEHGDKKHDELLQSFGRMN